MTNQLCHAVVTDEHLDFHKTVRVRIHDGHAKRGQRPARHACPHEVPRGRIDERSWHDDVTSFAVGPTTIRHRHVTHHWRLDDGGGQWSSRQPRAQRFWRCRRLYRHRLWTRRIDRVLPKNRDGERYRCGG